MVLHSRPLRMATCHPGFSPRRKKLLHQHRFGCFSLLPLFQYRESNLEKYGTASKPEKLEFEENLAATLNPEGTEIQFRSLKDGSLAKTVPLESPIDSSAVQVEVTSAAVVVRDLDDTYFYSLEDGKRMLNPLGEKSEPMSLSMELTPNRRYALWWKWGMGEAVITDAHTGAEIRRIKDHAQFFRMMDNSTVVAVDGTMGITIRRYDLTDQSQDKIWRPFWWVMPLQAFVVMGAESGYGIGFDFLDRTPMKLASTSSYSWCSSWP